VLALVAAKLALADDAVVRVATLERRGGDSAYGQVVCVCPAYLA
jgi:hypothetical protein